MNAKRFIKRHFDDGFLVVSAERENALASVNRRNTDRLAKILIALDLQFKKVYGGYVMRENGINTQEVSFVVLPYQYNGDDNYRHLSNEEMGVLGEMLRNLFNQESILVKEPGLNEAYLSYGIGKPVDILSRDIVYNDVNQTYYTDFRKNTGDKVNSNNRATRFSFV